MTEQEASGQVRDYATSIAAVVGVDAAQTETRVGPAPCETSGGETNGGEKTSGGETSGGETSGGETSGGETSGGEKNGGGETAAGAFYVQGNWQMPLPPTEHAATLARLRDIWVAQGYQVKRFHMFSDVEGLVIAENPVDGVELMVESAKPPVAVAVVIMTPCYAAA